MSHRYCQVSPLLARVSAALTMFELQLRSDTGMPPVVWCLVSSTMAYDPVQEI